jgi:hypothetical protein
MDVPSTDEIRSTSTMMIADVQQLDKDLKTAYDASVEAKDRLAALSILEQRLALRSPKDDGMSFDIETYSQNNDVAMPSPSMVSDQVFAITVRASPKCHVCNIDAPKACTGCGLVHYCCKAHQRNDWKAHKPVCRIK